MHFHIFIQQSNNISIMDIESSLSSSEAAPWSSIANSNSISGLLRTLHQDISDQVQSETSIDDLERYLESNIYPKVNVSVNAFINQQDSQYQLAESSLLVFSPDALSAMLTSSSYSSSSFNSNENQIHLPLLSSDYLRIPTLGMKGINTDEYITNIKKQLEFYMLNAFCDAKIHQMFDLIAGFPSTISTIQDLKRCLTHTHSEKKLIHSLLRSFNQRLLHPGVSTTSILLMFVCSIKALRVLDPTGFILDKISEPIKNYLRNRPETVRCVVLTMTTDANGELSEELANELGSSEEIENANGNNGNIDDDENDPMLAEKWEPIPYDKDFKIDHSHSTTANPSENIDIIGKLIQIYGSNELFVNEYQYLLGEKLLNHMNLDIDQEIVNLESLKKRFGDAAMSTCDIMLKDITNSKRINTAISKSLASDAFDATIMSRHYWPKRCGGSLALSDNDQRYTPNSTPFKLHPNLQRKAKAYADQYSKMKASQRLAWKHEMGTAKIELESKNGQLRTFEVTALQATLILHFGENETWKSKNLSEKAGVDLNTCRKTMSYWIKQGVLKERHLNDEDDVEYYPVDSSAGDGNEHDLNQSASSSTYDSNSGIYESVDDDGEEINRLKGGANTPFQDMEKYYQFIEGMLKNLGELSLDRVHNNLCMFLQFGEVKYDKTMNQLGAYLDYLVSIEKLEKTSSGYQVTSSQVVE